MGQFDPYDYTGETLAALDTLAVLDPIMATDGYKLGHVEMYPENLTGVLANFTARSSRISGISAVVAFGMRAAMVKVYMDWQKFFRADIDEVTAAYTEQVRTYLNLPDDADVRVDHLRTLHYYGRLPLRVRALDEGTLVPLNVPMMTVESTQPWAAWLVNYIETALSWRMWQPITTATLAWRMRRMLDQAAKDTGAALEGVPFQAHDFSARGLTGDDAVAASGAAHLVAFYGTDSLPAIGFIRRFYGGSPREEIIAASVLASEHSVMSAGMADQPAVLNGNPDETELVRRILAKNPTGIVSLVGDTFNLWHFITNVLAAFKDSITTRDGKIVVRPDCYDDQTSILTPRGWVLFSELRDDDQVAQVHPDGTYSFVTPLKRTRMDYNGLMVRFKDERGKCDLLVTPNHRMLWNRRKTGDRVVEAGMSTVNNVETKMYRTAAGIDRGVKLSPLDRFRIAFQADGSYPSKVSNNPTSGERSYRFNFAKQRKVDRLIAICEDGGFRYSIHEEDARAGQKTIYVWLPSDVLVVKDFSWVDTSSLCGGWSREFIEEASYWDGTRRSAERFKLDTASPEVCDVLELVALSAGYGALRTVREDARSDLFSNCYTLHVMKDHMLGSQAITKSYEWYTGDIHCVTVPTGMLMVKRGRATAVCGNSGDPALILCGDPDAPEGTPERKGVIELLWEIFGGTANAKNYRELDSHIGAIYGDGITFERAMLILARLAENGYSSTNVVLGMGSFGYQYQTRDTFGMAMKTTWVELDRRGYGVRKDPITDNGGKRSAKGRLAVLSKYDGTPYLVEEATFAQEDESLLRTFFDDGKFVTRGPSFAQVRETLRRSQAARDRAGLDTVYRVVGAQIIEGEVVA